MENVDLHGALKRLPKLIDRAEQGENFIITRAGKPRVHLTAVDCAEEPQMIPGLLASEVAAAFPIPPLKGPPAALWNARWNIKRLSSNRIGRRTTGWRGKCL